MDCVDFPEAEAAFDAGEMLESLWPVWENASL